MYCVSCEVRTEFICYVEESGPPLWSSVQSSWLQIQRSGFDSRLYQIFWEEVDLELGPLKLLSTSEDLLERKSRDSGLESREHCRRNPLRWPRGTPYPQTLALRLQAAAAGRSRGLRPQSLEFNDFSLCSRSDLVRGSYLLGKFSFKRWVSVVPNFSEHWFCYFLINRFFYLSCL
jgi:hypothetical protein